MELTTARLASLAFLMAGMTPAQTAPGRMVDVGGYRVHLDCTGAGKPAVMIIGGFSFDWALVQPEVAKVTRVCTYDASGNAWSDTGPVPTCSGRVEEIRRLLSKGGIDGPYVLVGLSTGALFARVYARRYPSEVAGMVFIDHAFLPAAPAPPAAPVLSGPDSPPAVIYAAPIEIEVEDEPGFDKLPASVRELHRRAMSRHSGRPDAAMAEACASEVGDATLGALPLVVVSTANDAPGYAKLQSSLLGLSRRSRQLIAAHSFHSIEISQPEIATEAIRLVIEETRK